MKKKRNLLGSAIAALLGTACALVLGFVFYGAMAYQLLDEDGAAQSAAQAHGGRLTLSGARLVSEQTVVSEYGAQTCTALVRSYVLANGKKAEAITAKPAAYIERLSEDGYAPQPVTGYVLAGMDAVYARREDEAALCARAGETIFMLCVKADEKEIYSLGAGAYME